MRGSDLADAVADDRIGRDAPAVPHRSEADLHREEGRLRDLGALDARLALERPNSSSSDHSTCAAQQFVATLDHLAEHGGRCEQVTRPSPTTALPCPVNTNATRRRAAGLATADGDAGLAPTLAEGAQALDDVVDGVADHGERARRGEYGAAQPWRRGRASAVSAVASRWSANAVAMSRECGRALRREHEQRRSRRGGRDGHLRGLLHDDVGVGAAEPERADPGDARRWPAGQQ